jgi:hypothetical protein
MIIRLVAVLVNLTVDQYAVPEGESGESER